MKVSVIIPCKNRLAHLQETIPFVLKQDYPDFEVIIVDYNCPQNTWGWAHGLVSPRVSPMKARVGENEWSLSASRNMGYRGSDGDILLFLDADAKLTWPDFITRHVEHCIDGSFICGWGFHDATGCCMLRRSAFEAAGGYNEAIKSWGMEDIDLYSRLENKLAQERRIWLGGIETIKHGDEWRNYYHGGRDPMQTNQENFHIAQNEFKGI